MKNLIIGIIFYFITIQYLEGGQITSADINEFDFIKKFELSNQEKVDSNGNIFYRLNHKLSKKFKLSDIFDSKKPDSAVIDIIFRLEIPDNVTFDLFEISDNSKSDPLKGSVYFGTDSDISESNSDSESYNLADYESIHDWYRLTFFYDFEESKLFIFYNCDLDNAYLESIERKGFLLGHHRLQYHNLLHVSMGGLNDPNEKVDFQFDVMKLTLYTGGDYENLDLCPEMIF